MGQHEIYRHLEKHGETSLKELEKATGNSASAVSKAVRRMEAWGDVESRVAPGPVNSRQKIVKLSKKTASIYSCNRK